MSGVMFVKAPPAVEISTEWPWIYHDRRTLLVLPYQMIRESTLLLSGFSMLMMKMAITAVYE
jgi:hypothetical protein